MEEAIVEARRNGWPFEMVLITNEGVWAREEGTWVKES